MVTDNLVDKYQLNCIICETIRNGQLLVSFFELELTFVGISLNIQYKTFLGFL